VENGKYDDIPNPRNVESGQGFTKSQKDKIKAENSKRNNRELTSDKSGQKLNPSKQNIKGQKADMNQAEVDHIVPKSKGGTNASSNAKVVSKTENLKKGNKNE